MKNSGEVLATNPGQEAIPARHVIDIDLEQTIALYRVGTRLCEWNDQGQIINVGDGSYSRYNIPVVDRKILCAFLLVDDETGRQVRPSGSQVRLPRLRHDGIRHQLSYPDITSGADEDEAHGSISVTADTAIALRNIYQLSYDKGFVFNDRGLREHVSAEDARVANWFVEQLDSSIEIIKKKQKERAIGVVALTNQAEVSVAA